MERFDYDVLVIGGGPGGACAAAFARQRGWRVAVVEKEVFPRFRIGESLLPAGNAVLRATGVWSKLEVAGFVEKFGARFVLPGGRVEKRVDFSKGYVPGLERTFQVERARFDTILLEHAQELGAEVMMGTRVSRLTEEATGVSAMLEGAAAGSGTRTLRARWVIEATGRETMVPGGPSRVHEADALPRRLAVYGHFRGVARAGGAAGGDTVIVRLAGGWFRLIPLDAERTSVGLVTTPAALRAGGARPEEHFWQVVGQVPWLRQAMARAAATGAFHVTTDYSYFHLELASGRVVRVGDAGGFYDPIFSSGVYLATWSAQQAVALLAQADAGERGRALRGPEREGYARHVQGHAAVFRRLIEAFYDDDAFAVFMTKRPPLDIARGITSIVAGHAELSWPLWWRFRLFLLVCRLQRRWQLAPSLGEALRVQSPAGAALAPREDETGRR